MLAVGVCALSLGTGASAPPLRGYDLKAALLLNLSRFVEWPATAFARPEAPFVIGILGDDPFGPSLDELVRPEKCGERVIRIERYRNVDAAQNCQILFVSSSEEAEFPRIFRVLRARPVVTVGDALDFDTRGGMIRFVDGAGGRVQLRINHDAVQAAGLTMSAKLLRLAETTAKSRN
jgi:hypothetical protein